MALTTIMDGDGNQQDVPKAKETGTWHDPAGVPRLVVEGDPIPVGWTKDNPVEGQSAEEGGSALPARAARGKARSAPAEDK